MPGFNVTTTPAPGWPMAGRVLSLASDEIVLLGAVMTGILEIVRSDASMGVFDVRGGFNAVIEVRDSAGNFSTTKDTASSTNVYYDASGPSGAGYYIQLKGSARNYRLYFRGVFAYPF